jgi:hypothetical protein
MPYEIRTIAGRECLLNIDNNAQEDIVEALQRLFLNDADLASEALMWLPEEKHVSQKIILLITSLFSLFSTAGWDDLVCQYHRITLGLLDACLQHASHQMFQQYLIDKLNTELLTGKEFKAEEYPPMYTALYYGEHYDGAWYNNEMRLYDAQQPAPLNNLYSRNIYNITNLQVGDRYYSPAEIQQLDCAVTNQLAWFYQLDERYNSPQACYHEGPGNEKKYITPGDMHHQRAVGAYFNFLEDAKAVTEWKLGQYAQHGQYGLSYQFIIDNKIQVNQNCQARPKTYNKPGKCTDRSAPLFVGFESKIYQYTTLTAFDPYIPTTTRVETAIKYATNDGIEAWDMPLDQSQLKNRDPIGKVYVFLFELGEFRSFLKTRKMLSTFDEMSYAREHINDRRLPEDEYSFRSQIPAKNIVGKVVIRKEDSTTKIEGNARSVVAEKVRKYGGFYVYVRPDATLSLQPPGEMSDASKIPISYLYNEIKAQKQTPETDPIKVALRKKQTNLDSSLSKKTTSGERKVFSPNSPFLFSDQARMKTEILSPQKPRTLWPESSVEEQLTDMLLSFSHLRFYHSSENDHRYFGLQITDVAYEVGNCLFEAIAYFTPELSGERLRNRAVSHIREDQQLRTRLTELAGMPNTTVRNHAGEDLVYVDVDNYLELMERNQTWGSLIEITALSTALQRRIVVLTPNNEYDQIIEEDGFAESETIFVNYQGGDHYRPLFIPSKETAEKILERIRHRIKQRHQFNGAAVLKPTQMHK